MTRRTFPRRGSKRVPQIDILSRGLPDMIRKIWFIHEVLELKVLEHIMKLFGGGFIRR